MTKMHFWAICTYEDACRFIDQIKPYRGDPDGVRPICKTRERRIGFDARYDADGSVVFLYNGDPAVVRHPDGACTIYGCVNDRQGSTWLLAAAPRADDYRLWGKSQSWPSQICRPDPDHDSQRRGWYSRYLYAQFDWKDKLVLGPDGRVLDDESLTPWTTHHIDRKAAREVSRAHRLPEFTAWFSAFMTMTAGQPDLRPEHYTNSDLDDAADAMKAGDFLEAFRHLPRVTDQVYGRHSYWNPKWRVTHRSVQQVREHLYSDHGVIRSETSAKWLTWSQLQRSRTLAKL